MTLQKREHQQIRKGQVTEAIQLKSEIRGIERNSRTAQKSADKQKQTRRSLFEQKARQFQTRRNDIQIHKQEELNAALQALQQKYYEQQVQVNPIIEAKIPRLGGRSPKVEKELEAN